jgi:hypothetical protein
LRKIFGLKRDEVMGGWRKQHNEELHKTDLKEIGWDGMDWIDLAQDKDQWRALVNTVMNLWVS